MSLPLWSNESGTWMPFSGGGGGGLAGGGGSLFDVDAIVSLTQQPSIFF